MNSSVSHLPEIYYQLVPELKVWAWAEETRANCGDCRLAKPTSVAIGPRFKPKLRCCTYHPALPNFLVGRILRAGGEGAARMRTRLAEPQGVSLQGVRHTRREHGEVGMDSWDQFGRDESLQCPFLSDGDGGCSIWSNRGAVCRTWYCSHDQGESGRGVWWQTKDLLASLEQAVRQWCEDRLVDRQPPAGAGWEPWFVACAEVVDHMEPQTVVGLRSEAMNECVSGVRKSMEVTRSPIPDRVMACINTVDRAEGAVVIYGYSGWDVVRTDMRIFAFLALLDGSCSWQDALAKANSTLEDPLDPEVIGELWRIGALSEVSDVDVAPGATLIIHGNE